jgi:hypothetical protein
MNAVSETSLTNNWMPRGRLYGSEVGAWWMSGGAYAFMPLVEPDGIVRFFACGRDDQGRSRIGIIRFKWGETPKLLDVTRDPVLDLGDPGCFDMDGVAYPYLVQSHGRLLMYYVGWNKLGGRAPWVTNLGLAVSDDDGSSFKRVTRAPILPRTNDDPIGSASSCIVPHGDGSWTLYYTKLLSWDAGMTPPGPCYNIWKARSTDGVSWSPLNQNVIGHDKGEYALCAPCLHRFGDQTVMFFSARGHRYRLFAAPAAADGSFRKINQPLRIVPGDWDDDMQCYGHVVAIHDRCYIFYCGNGFGRAGVGYAEWKTQ